MRLVARILVRAIADVRVEGLENVPATGPCFLIPNHQSWLDPLLVQGMCPRVISTMTKSIQFTGPVVGYLLRVAQAFPVRRYQVDSQAVRILLRRLGEGGVVCVYPEGERCWDGTLQPLRRGTIRVALRAGAPVVPVGIDGMYDAWPRFASKPRFGHTVYLRFGAPLHFGRHETKEEREAALPAAEAALRDALLTLSGEGGRKDGYDSDVLLETSLTDAERPGPGQS
jgi:1-acyl-sn-glycerol-3-phosphate acyltransferase